MESKGLGPQPGGCHKDLAKLFEEMSRVFLRPLEQSATGVPLEDTLRSLILKQMSYREMEWLTFSERVRQHIVDYTMGQFGDYPNDQVTEWNAEDCVKAIRKYVARFGTEKRGKEEQVRDFLKIAHYACLGLAKYEQGGMGKDAVCGEGECKSD